MTLRTVAEGGVGRPARVNAWWLSGLGVRAFGDQPQTKMQWPLLRTTCLRVLLLVSATVSERRVHPDGDAFCLLTRPSLRGRVVASALGALIALPVVALVAYLPVLFWLVVLLLAVLLAPSGLLAVRSRAARTQLGSAGPTGPVVGVHTVTSLRSGHGAELMAMVVEEADAEGWLLVLDAANERLERYYQRFGFAPCGAGVLMPWGERVVRMRRQPAAKEGQ